MGFVIFNFKEGTVIESEFDDSYTNDLLDTILTLLSGEEVIQIKQLDGKMQKYTIDCKEFKSVSIHY